MAITGLIHSLRTKQYKLKLKEWEFRKYCKSDEREILEKTQKAGAEDPMKKKSSLGLNGYRFRSQKIERLSQATSFSDTENMTGNSKTSCEVAVYHVPY